MRTLGAVAIFAFLGISVVSEGQAVRIYQQFPSDIHPNERYVIFSHGLIAEGEDPHPISPKYGVYAFPEIKAALFKDGGFNLIAVQRKTGVELENHVNQLESWVHRLLDAGVKPSRVTLVGFSRGGQITALASGHLASEGINTALLAICAGGDFAVDSGPPIALGGNFLSIYETSDELGSCAKLADRGHLKSFTEVAISTGKAHGAFFQPRLEWIDPLKAWIAKTNR
jgi:pimeloyl-ACP methyl ester carboxylesterase